MSDQSPQVCVLTGRSMAAIGSVAIAGAGAEEVLGKIFKTSSAAYPHTVNAKAFQSRLEAGDTVHGSIVDGQRVVDEVIVGCEGSESFVIHCHGNPLLLEQVVKQAQTHGAVLTDAESFAFNCHRAESANLIEAEAKLAMQTCATLTGVKILQSQIDGGLSVWAREMLENVDIVSADQVRQECGAILGRSRIAAYFTKGVRIVIAGAPNAGKSTLLNALAGQQQAIVSQAAGTTRDWVSVTCELKMPVKTDNNNVGLRTEFIDTAGLDDVLAGATSVDSQAQQMTRELLESCDLVLYVQEITEARSQKPEIRIAAVCPIISVFNKCDLMQEYRNIGIQECKKGNISVFISAKDAIGIDALVETIFNALRAGNFQYDKPVVFTERQHVIVEGIIEGRPLRSCLEQLLDK